MASPIPLHAMLRMIESPDFIARGARQAVRKRVTSRLDYRRADGYSAPPLQMNLKLVNACNLRCKMCPQWGETGYNLSRPSAELKNLISLDVYKRLVDDVAAIKPWVYIWGGEPFLYPDLLPLTRYIKAHGFTTSIVTNGTKLAKHAAELVETGLDVLLISVDGPRDTHDNVRGYKGAFDLTAAGIEAVQAEKKRRGKVKPYITLMSVVTEDNQDNLDQVFEIGDDLRIDMLMTSYAWFQTEESGARHTALMQEKMNITPWSWRGFMWDVSAINPNAVAKSVRRIKQRRWSFPYIFMPELELEQIPAYYAQHGNTFGHHQCRYPWIATDIMPNGDVITCRDYPDVVVGNIKSDSIMTLWNNPRSRRFRTLLKEEGGLLPICSRCCGLMGV